MIRDGLAPDSAHFSLFVTGSNGLAKQWRTCDGCITNDVGNLSIDGRNTWLKLIKTGNIFQAYFKTDDSSDWAALGSPETMNFSDMIYVGIAVTSHDNSKTADLYWSRSRSQSSSASAALMRRSQADPPVAFQVSSL